VSGKLISTWYLTILEKLTNESWDTIFNSEDVIAMFNSILNIYLGSSMPKSAQKE